MLYEFCPESQTLAVIFDKDNGGFSSCAADILFPTTLLVLAIVRVLMIRPKCVSFPFHAFSATTTIEGSSEVPTSPKENQNPREFTFDMPDTLTDNSRRESRARYINKVFIWLNILFPFHYAVVLVIHMTVEKLPFVWVWPVQLVVLKLAWFLATLSLEVEISRALDRNRPAKFFHNLVFHIFWISAVAYELVPVIDSLANDWPYMLDTTSNKILCALWALRLVHTLVVLFLGIYAPGLPKKSRKSVRKGSNEEQELVEDASFKLTSEEDSTFKNLYLKLKFLWPYIWPKNEPLLQLYVVLCFFILILGRIANIFIPLFYSKVVTALSEGDLSSMPYSYIGAYCVFYFLTGSGFGGSGFLSNVRSFLWISVQQYSMRTTMVQIFTHLHGLSLRWHLG